MRYTRSLHGIVKEDEARRPIASPRGIILPFGLIHFLLVSYSPIHWRSL